MTEEQLSALLRLKRHEQPPPGYYDRLLQDVHRRQRAELLQQPLWKIAWERMQTFFGEHSMSPASYAGAMASVVLAGFMVAAGLSGGRDGALTAKNGGAGSNLVASVAPPAALPSRAVRLDTPTRSTATTAQVAQKDSYRPRYVIDARLASYEQSLSF